MMFEDVAPYCFTRLNDWWMGLHKAMYATICINCMASLTSYLAYSRHCKTAFQTTLSAVQPLSGCWS